MVKIFQHVCLEVRKFLLFCFSPQALHFVPFLPGYLNSGNNIMFQLFWINSDSYNRMLRIKNLRWEFGTVLPEEIKYNLCEQEVKEVKKKWF